MNKYPRITIVTPSYNQGKFIEETILSVLNQNYPNLEYFIFDGGSTDNSVDIIKKYSDRINLWVSEADEGQAAVIAKGFDKATGEWFNWLNSDDVLMPNALFALAEVIESNTLARWISGAKINIDKNNFYGSSEIPWQTDPGVFCEGKALFPQDATFIHTAFMREKGICVRAEYRYAMDTALYYELLNWEKPLLTTIVFSGMRWHEQQKSGVASQRQLESDQAAAKYKRSLTLLERALARLARTRFHFFINSIRGFLVYHGLMGDSRLWQSWVFDHWTNTYAKMPARKFIRY